MRQFSDIIFKTFFYRLPPIVLCCFIFWQSSYPGMVSEPLFPYDDKVMHLSAYGLLGFLAARALKKENSKWSVLRISLMAIVFSCTFGLSDEIHQAFVPERTASAWDFLADCAGAAAGSLLYMKFLSLKILTVHHKT